MALHNAMSQGDAASERLIDRAVELCVAVTGSPRPSHEEQERVFAELDDLLDGITDREVDAILEAPPFRAVRDRLLPLRSEYEYVRERLLAEAIVSAGDESPIQSFRSASWYEDAHDFEIEALTPYAPRRLLHVGGGPFPTTAISFQRAYPEAEVACLDNDPEACALASEVVRICGCPRVEILQTEALERTDFDDYDCVIVGTVVGILDAEKEHVVEHFKRWVPPSALLVFRTAIGPGRVIYPYVAPFMLDGLNPRVLFDPPQKTFTMILTDRAHLVS